MECRIEHTKGKKVIGMRMQMSLITINQKTGELARQFMPRRQEIKSRIGLHVFSIQDFTADYNPQNPQAIFDKWVGAEVSNFDHIPNNMEAFTIEEGTYAVFSFKGSVQEFPKLRAHIFNEWLPNSDYELGARAHFEILSEDYNKDLQNIEEDVWVPLR